MKNTIINISKILSFCSLFLILSCTIQKDKVKEVENFDQVKEQYILAKMVGTEPFWSIEVYEDHVWFETPEIKAKEIPIRWVNVQEASRIVSTDEKFPLDIIIKEEFCSDGMSDQEFYYSAKGTFQGKTINGCTKWYLDNRYEGKWQLESAKDISLSDFEEKPYIEWESDPLQITGNLGCNGVMGRIVYKNQFPSLTYLSTTLMWCDQMEGETQLLKLMKKTTHWQIEERKLVAKKGTETLCRWVEMKN